MDDRGSLWTITNGLFGLSASDCRSLRCLRALAASRLCVSCETFDTKFKPEPLSKVQT